MIDWLIWRHLLAPQLARKAAYVIYIYFLKYNIAQNEEKKKKSNIKLNTKTRTIQSNTNQKQAQWGPNQLRVQKKKQQGWCPLHEQKDLDEVAEGWQLGGQTGHKAGGSFVTEHCNQETPVTSPPPKKPQFHQEGEHRPGPLMLKEVSGQIYAGRDDPWSFLVPSHEGTLSNDMLNIVMIHSMSRLLRNVVGLCDVPPSSRLSKHQDSSLSSHT